MNRLWVATGWLAVALAAAPAARANGHDLIVAGKGIGLFRLGMTTRDVQRATRTAPCAVYPGYERGLVTRLETNCGGAFATPERIMVGHSPHRILIAYGNPDRVGRSDYAGVRADWLEYRTAGIAFRVIHGSFGAGLIQAIAVFKGSGIRTPIPVTFPPAPAPPPGLGE